LHFFLIAAVVVSGVAALYDCRTGHIPNWLTVGAGLAALVGQLLFAAFAESGGGPAALRALGLAVAGAVLCGVGPAILFRLGAMGGGDVKLFAAIGALCLPTRGLAAETYAFLIALLMAPIWLAYRGMLLQTLKRSFALLANPLRPRNRRQAAEPTLFTWFRLGPAIFLGTAAMSITHFRGL